MHGLEHIPMGAGAPLWLLLIAALCMAAALAPLGAVMLWRRMAYFGDAISHAALFGVALALAAHLPPMLGIATVAVPLAVLVWRLRRGSGLGEDALLGTFAHGLLGLGLMLAFWLLGEGADVERALFGDIRAMGTLEAWAVIVGSLGVLALLGRLWPRLVLAALSEELAIAEGHAVRRAQLLVIIAAALMLALAARTIGVLLFTAMLVIPAAAARSLAREPAHMAAIGAFIGAISASGGLILAQLLDLPSGPVIVSLAFGFFVFFHLAARLRA